MDNICMAIREDEPVRKLVRRRYKPATFGSGMRLNGSRRVDGNVRRSGLLSVNGLKGSLLKSGNGVTRWTSPCIRCSGLGTRCSGG
jgi:hypothetical protein